MAPRPQVGNVHSSHSVAATIRPPERFSAGPAAGAERGKETMGKKSRYKENVAKKEAASKPWIASLKQAFLN
ncbi:unnamed protein product [Ascophyllum nodosum]